MDEPSHSDNNGTRWLGQAEASSRFWNYVVRMQFHLMGIYPYGAAWAILIRLYTNTLDDVQKTFDVDDAIPSYILSAVITTCLTFSSFSLAQIIWQYREPRFYWQARCAFFGTPTHSHPTARDPARVVHRPSCCIAC